MIAEYQYDGLRSAGIAAQDVLKAADALLKEHPIQPTFVYSHGLTAVEAEFLSQGGAKGVNTPALALSHSNTASIVGEYGILVATSLNQEQVAKMLHVSASRIRQKLSDGSLYSIATEQGKVCPLWQFHQNQLIPQLDKLLAHLAADCHPVVVARFMTTKHPDLESKDFPGTYSPVEWLSSGHLVNDLIPLVEEL